MILWRRVGPLFGGLSPKLVNGGIYMVIHFRSLANAPQLSQCERDNRPLRQMRCLRSF